MSSNEKTEKSEHILKLYRSPLSPYACASSIEKNYVVSFCWNVLIGAPGRRLYEENINPNKVTASVKLMYF